MISIRFLVFFYDEKEDRAHRLAATTPLFSSPSAVKTLMRTAKFQNRPALVVCGEKPQLETLVKKVERLDVTDWLALETWEELRVKLVAAVKSVEGLSVYDDPMGESIVFGDDEEEVIAAVKYPPDLPAENRALWDEIYTLYRDRVKGSDDEKAAILRRLYAEYAKKGGFIPWVPAALEGPNRLELLEKMKSGEKKAQDLLEQLSRYALSDGILKRAKPLKYCGAYLENTGVSRYVLTLEAAWTLTDALQGWKTLTDYLIKREAFLKLGPRMMSLKISQLTDIEVFGALSEQTVMVCLNHRLTEAQAALLVGQAKDVLQDLKKIAEGFDC